MEQLSIKTFYEPIVIWKFPLWSKEIGYLLGHKWDKERVIRRQVISDTFYNGAVKMDNGNEILLALAPLILESSVEINI